MSPAPRHSDPLEVLTLRVHRTVKKRLLAMAAERGEPPAEFVRAQLATIALDAPRGRASPPDTALPAALEAVAKELSEFRADARARDELLLDRFDRLLEGLRRSITALLRLAASDSRVHFSEDEVLSFASRVFDRRSGGADGE